MNFLSRTISGTVAGLIVSALFSATVHAAGLMTPVRGNLPQLSIREHHVDVVIEDGYAITTVEQVFANPHDDALEAIYSFPVPQKAAVGEFTYWIDGKPVTGEVLEKQAARDLYEQEKAQGRQAALTEKDEYRTFDISVYPVLPNNDVRIRLVYIQPVHTDLGIGRYVYPLQEGGVDERRMNFWTYNSTVEEAFSFNLQMRSSYPVDEFRLPAHPQVMVQEQSPQDWRLSFGNQQAKDSIEEGDTGGQVLASHNLDEDIVVYWRHAQGLPGAVDLVTHREEGEKRGTFMLTVTPGDDLGLLEQGRDWVFVLDYSGSMAGKYQTLVEGVREGLDKLSERDRFQIILFNNGVREVTSGYVPVNQQNVERYIRELEAITPDGGTNLYAGLQRGYRLLDADRPSAVILVTDGVANVGVTERKDFLRLLEKHDVRLFSFVMGNSANRPLLEGMATLSNGFSVNVSNNDDIGGLLVQAADKLKYESYRDVEVKFSGIKVKELAPERIGSLYRGQQIILFGHYWGDGPAKVTVGGKVLGENRTYTSELDFPKVMERNPELERLWAYAAIEDLQNRIDYLGTDADSRQAITDIALEYDLVTNYTSMIVVAEDVFEAQGIDRSNKTRVEEEASARKQRAAQPVKAHRQDSTTPAFGNSSRAYPSNGAGSVGLFGVLLLLPLLLLTRSRRA